LRLLLDSHAVLWWLSADTRFGDEAARQVSDDTNQVLLSAAVVWEGA
jgi:PIN domain nuclease of toxin-antitoxin system